MEGSESVSAVSREDNVLGLSSEDSSCPDESELELGLGLSLRCSGKAQKTCQYARILTAKDFPSMGSSSSSSCSSSALSRANSSAGTKRPADSASQVVGWPPIRANRMNSMVNQAKSTATEEYGSMVEKGKCENILMDKANNGCDKNCGKTKENGQLRSSLFVKVNMDGCQIGRKIDLNAHSSYETLAKTLEDMFFGPTTVVGPLRPSRDKHDSMMTATSGSKLLNGLSDFVLTYEDREGDWMLVGDVPWGMFVSSVKRLRIMKTSEANGLDSRIQEKKDTPRSKCI